MDLKRLVMTILFLAGLGLVLVYAQRIAGSLASKAGV